LTVKLSQEGPNIVKAIGLFLVLALVLGLFLPFFWTIPGAFTAALIYFIGSAGETKPSRDCQ
jgi:predicted membrane-bound dolichyl-phosphate-mannose-protein mannosyltransferase